MNSISDAEMRAASLLVAQPRAGLTGDLLDLLDANSIWRSSPVLRRIREAILQNGPAIRSRPALLFQACFNYLWWCEPAPGLCRQYAQSLLARRAKTGSRWLRQVFGPGPSSVHIMSEHVGRVTSVRVLSDDQVVSAGVDGTVRVWNPVSGDLQTIFDAAAQSLSRLGVSIPPRFH